MSRFPASAIPPTLMHFNQMKSHKIMEWRCSGFTPIGGDGSGDCDNEEHCIISLRFYPLKGLLPIPDIGITAADIFTIISPSLQISVLRKIKKTF